MPRKTKFMEAVQQIVREETRKGIHALVTPRRRPAKRAVREEELPSARKIA